MSDLDSLKSIWQHLERPDGWGRAALEVRWAIIEIERLRAENIALRNLVNNLQPGPISEALAGTRYTRESGLTAERDALKVALEDAIECVESWSGYVSEYFKDKHKLADDLTRLRTAIAAVPAADVVPAEKPRHPGYVIGDHWLEAAYSRLCAGDAEDDIMRDYGWARIPSSPVQQNERHGK